MSLSTVTVTGSWVTGANQPAVGQVTFAPVQEALGGGYIVAASGVTVQMVNGAISTTLVNNTQATSLQYLVTEQIIGSPNNSYVITPTGTSLDLSTVPRGAVGVVTPTYVQASTVGAANGIASLDSGAHVPLAQLPALPESQVTNLTTDLSARVLKGELVFDVRDYGATGNGQRVRNVTASTASAVVTFSSASFTSADVGKTCVVYTDTACGAITTILSVQSTTQVTLAANAGITVSGATGYFLYGTDDSAALTSAFTAAAAAASTDTTVGPNQPQGLGQPVVLVPNTSTGSLFVLANAVTVPSGVMLDCVGMLANLTASTTAPVVTFSPYSSGRRIYVECMFNSGIQLGSTAGVQADVHMGTVVLWHVGKSSGQIGVNALGYGFLTDLIWMKGGNTGIVHNAGSDWFCNRAFIIGAHTAISMSQSNQVRYNGIILDSCGEVGGGYSGIVLDNACSYITFAVQAFEVTGITRSLDNVVLLGNGSSNKNVVVNMDVVAEKTGGNVLNLNQAQDVAARIIASNTASNSSGGNNITTAVVYGTVAGSAKIEAALSGTVTPYSGTVPGPYTVAQAGAMRVFQGGSAPTLALTTSVTGTGGSVGATVTAGNDARGKISVTAGNTGPFAAGILVTVTFASSTGYVAAPFPIVTATNSAAAALGLYISSVTATGFVVSCLNAPAASGNYTFNYQIVG